MFLQCFRLIGCTALGGILMLYYVSFGPVRIFCIVLMVRLLAHFVLQSFFHL
ncbi:hypothetical protein JHK82_033435 [Glycine max]|uniref:Uncharacterized protein n=2 Tax=Glycine subgen. Soja TaxID=1462606 RepID=K7LU79_SOYBN|nr:hypothetical protein JHK87_033377 [Glycine soja]KAG4980197.1 hypothetical protein JHK85_034155 [Glycine max]KAG4985834.1 hypothetical protein JHK86_033525 [Glycine max]KAG5119015.1 hypothetical protein JHK82_033435 [Glycine max]KAG5140009.1 hypothetical protein JHK84_033777 [Glycine max]